MTAKKSKRLLARACASAFACVLMSWSGLAQGQEAQHDLMLSVRRLEGRKFLTQASFRLPLRNCQAWGYLTDYDSSASIPGVLSAKTTRLGRNMARVSLTMEEQVLFLKVRMGSVIDFVELENLGTDFVQRSGDAKSFFGTWRIEPQAGGTLFRYHSVFEPDSALPMAVIQYFLDRRLRSNFAAIAQIGAAHQHVVCD